MKTFFAILVFSFIGLASYSQTDLCYWIEPDDTYENPTTGNWGNSADNYSPPIPLPFTFDFFGQSITEIVLTTKGTIVMGSNGYVDFTPSAFPDPLANETSQQYDHICGFWSDFDFGGSGELYYKVTDDA